MHNGQVGVVASFRSGLRTLCAANRCVWRIEFSSNAAVHSVHLYIGSLAAVALILFRFSALLSCCSIFEIWSLVRLLNQFMVSLLSIIPVCAWCCGACVALASVALRLLRSVANCFSLLDVYCVGIRMLSSSVWPNNAVR